MLCWCLVRIAALAFNAMNSTLPFNCHTNVGESCDDRRVRLMHYDASRSNLWTAVQQGVDNCRSGGLDQMTLACAERILSNFSDRLMRNSETTIAAQGTTNLDNDVEFEMSDQS